MSDASSSERSERALAMLRVLSASPHASPNDRLEDAGIDSLDLAEFAVAIEREFGVAWPMGERVDHPSVAESGRPRPRRTFEAGDRAANAARRVVTGRAFLEEPRCSWPGTLMGTT
jgi:hypothetical protein